MSRLILIVAIFLVGPSVKGTNTSGLTDGKQTTFRLDGLVKKYFLQVSKYETKSIERASGFFVTRAENGFFVTARHVIEDTSSESHVKSGSIFLRNGETHEDTTGLLIKLDLDVLLEDRNIALSSNCDVAVIRLGDILGGKLVRGVEVRRKGNTTSLSIAIASLIACDSLTVDDRVLVIGYPAAPDSHAVSAGGLAILSGKIVAVSCEDRVVSMDYGGSGGLSGSPVFVFGAVSKGRQADAQVMGVHVGRWMLKGDEDGPQFLSSVVISSDEIIELIETNWPF